LFGSYPYTYALTLLIKYLASPIVILTGCFAGTVYHVNER